MGCKWAEYNFFGTASNSKKGGGGCEAKTEMGCTWAQITFQALRGDARWKCVVSLAKITNGLGQAQFYFFSKSLGGVLVTHGVYRIIPWA